MPRADIIQACKLHDRAVAARADGKYDQAVSLGQRALALLENWVPTIPKWLCARKTKRN